MKKGFITNKYTISVFILLAILAVDIYLHKGMSRVIIPKSFTSQRQPQTNLPACKNSITVKGKKWLKAINSLSLAAKIDSSSNGFETDVYFDSSRNTFFVYHDSTAISNLELEELLEKVYSSDVKASIWLDFKNLSPQNSTKALNKLLAIRTAFGLQQKMIVESDKIDLLPAFCDSNFYTSYYTPFFNPYDETEEKLVARIDSISGLLKKYPVSALSGYYFQTPFLVKFFPDFPILTWADDARVSIVGNVFKYRLEQQQHIKIVLYSSD